MRRFFCTECNQFMDRRFVKYDEWDQKYHCKLCGSPVLKTIKVLERRLRDDIELIVKCNKEDFFQ